MYDYEHGWSLSFSACGFLIFYHFGATQCLRERAPHILRDARMFFGSSAGALHCVTFLSGLPPERILQIFRDNIWKIKNRSIGLLHPSNNIVGDIQVFLRESLPANIHKIISGKVCLSLTRLSDGQNVLVSDFQSKDEVVDALVCSSFIPGFFGLIPPTFRGVRYIDGGLTNSLPFSDSKTTITVAPFYGEFDISPKVKSTNFLFVNINQLRLLLCSKNIHLLHQVLLPREMEVSAELFLQGYLDAARFLEEKGICAGPHPCPGLSSREPGVAAFPWETMSLETSPEAAARQRKPLRGELLPWDERVLKISSPGLIRALNVVTKSQRGYIDKICDFLPVKIVSYMMLPCTLPVEFVASRAWRLVKGLPDIPDDIRCLWSITSQICSLAMTHLLPASRSQMPASSQPPSPHKPAHGGPSGLPAPRGPSAHPVQALGSRASAGGVSESFEVASPGHLGGCWPPHFAQLRVWDGRTDLAAGPSSQLTETEGSGKVVWCRWWPRG